MPATTHGQSGNFANRPVFGAKKIAIIVIVLLIAGYKWYTAPTTVPSQPTGDEASYLTPVKGGLESPGGLIYGKARGGELRSDHVLRHAKDIPDRAGPHGVFDAKGDDVFRIIDESYELVNSRSGQVTTSHSDGKDIHVVDMKRRIGYKGGQTGARQNHPPLKRIKLVLDENRIITAYPY